MSFHNYMDRFDLLLYLEEDQMRMDIKRYNKHDVPMVRDRDKRLLVLEVSGSVLLSVVKVCVIVLVETAQYYCLSHCHMSFSGHVTSNFFSIFKTNRIVPKCFTRKTQ